MKSDVISTPTVTQSVTNIKIEWSEPNSNGDPIQYYVVQIQNVDGEFVEHDLYCHRVETNTCSIPMVTLIDSQDMFRLTLGTVIQARVSSVNSKGISEFSGSNTEGAQV
jgi:hypothetical protein